MIIKSFHVQHYKSLEDVELDDLSPITLLVGNNATGKSNIVDALRFLRDSTTDGLDHAISLRGGISTIRQYSPTRPFVVRMRVTLQQTIQPAEGPEEYRDGIYDLRVKSLRAGNYCIESEEISWFREKTQVVIDKEGDPIEERSLGIYEQKIFRDADGSIRRDDKTLAYRLGPDELLIRNSRITSRSWDLNMLLSSLRFSALYPNTLRSPSRPDTDRQLKESGENWASILKAMKGNERGRKRFDAILALMKRILPGLIDVRVQSVGGYLVPKFIVKDAPLQKEHDFDPVQLSDGTLRVFGILLALYQLPAPRFLALEEPELTVNPAVLAVLAEAFNDVAGNTQLLITTHSPELIDYFDPKAIRVVSFHQGRTKASSIKSSQVKSIKERLTTAGELLQRGNILSEVS